MRWMSRFIGAGFVGTLVACDSGSTGESAARIEVSTEVHEDVPTVVTVRWSTPEAVISHLEYGREDAGEVVLAEETEPSREHERLVLGLRAETEYHARVVTEAGTTPEFTFETGALDPELVRLTVTGTSDLGAGFVLASTAGTTWGPIVLDAEGNIVWWHRETEEFATTRAWLSRDGTAIFYNAMHDTHNDLSEAADGHIVRVPLDGSPVVNIPVPYLSHDFLELPDGSFAAIVLNQQDIDGATVIGNALVEVSADGATSREVWNAFETLDPRTTTRPDDGLSDWTHANALDYDEAADAWYLSLRNFGSILKIDRPTGALDWALSGSVNTFTFDDPAGRFRVSHQFEYRDGHMLVFDNGDATRPYSRVLDLAVDEAALTASLVSAYEPDTYVYILGDVHTLQDGSHLLALGTSGEIRRISADGTVLCSAVADLGHGFGYLQPLDRFGPP